ncbi:MAG: peptidylprolyl isomerase [Bdellovibrionales bacterium]
MAQKSNASESYHVAHILVPHHHEAQDILKLLKEGKDFAELAKRFSQCPSRARGGDLGPLPRGKADPDFEDAALLLSVGKLSEKPVRTRFGYHILKRLA